jgi:hypothetical protein
MLRAVAAALAAAGLFACMGGPPTLDVGGTPDADGLRPLLNTRFSRAFARPGLELSRYSRIWLESAGVEYGEAPESPYGGQIDSATAPLKRDELEAELLATFREFLFADGGWKVAEAAGADVLLVRVALVDVDVYVPPEPISSRTRVILEASGRATLLLSAHDSTTNEALVRFADRRDFESAVGPRQSTSLTNRQQVRRTIEAWAQLARVRLDELRTVRLPAP